MSCNELLSYGYSFAAMDERVERLRETVLILKAMWTKDQATFEGRYYRVLNAVNYPKPIQKPHPPLWIGGKHPKILDVVAEMADGWNYWGITRETLARRSSYLSDKCATIGRQPQQITKSWTGTLTHLTKTNRDSGQLVENIREQLRSQTDTQTKYFIASLGSRADTSIYEAFAEAVKSLD
jgi:alkanesulfonate monooxygenase SsuD/methylene tetrahydromethanopterin reductase-like flavin-dependent oxidoreductase (luciferase family)